MTKRLKGPPLKIYIMPPTSHLSLDTTFTTSFSSSPPPPTDSSLTKKFQLRGMESNQIKQVKKGKVNSLPPKRGQIKVKIITELVETVVNIAGKPGKKNERGGEHRGQASGYSSDDEKN